MKYYRVFSVILTILMFSLGATAQSVGVVPPKPKLETKLVLVDASGNRSVESLDRWRSKSTSDKQRYGKVALEVKYGQQTFTLGLKDFPDMTLTFAGKQVPTSAQWKIIENNLNAINDALAEVGGEPIGAPSAYWKREDKNGGEKTVRMCVDGSSKFSPVECKPAYGEKYETIGQLLDGVKVGICDERYGYIDANGKIVVPTRYNYLTINGVASEHGLYGMIDHRGRIIVPFIYQGITQETGGLNKVLQENLWGAIDYNGNLVVDIIYDDIVAGKVKPAVMAKKGGKYRLLDATGSAMTQGVYDKVVSAQDYGFGVERDGRPLYLGIDGKEYSNAAEMTNGVLSHSSDIADQYIMAQRLTNDHKYYDALKYLEPAANGGYAPAQCLMGYYYMQGRASCKKSDSVAMEWFTKAANNGSQEAAYQMGLMYENGIGVYRNPEIAIKWYRKSNGYKDAEDRIRQLSH